MPNFQSSCLIAIFVFLLVFFTIAQLLATVVFVSFTLVRENLRGLREFLFHKIRTQVGLDRPQIQTYRDLLTKLPAGSQVLENCYDSVEKTIKDVKGQIISEFPYETIVSPKIPTKKFPRFLP